MQEGKEDLKRQGRKKRKDDKDNISRNTDRIKGGLNEARVAVKEGWER